MERITILLLPAIVAIIATGILIYFNFQLYILYITIFAGVTQVIMFGIWFIGDRRQQQIVEDVSEIKETVATTKETADEIREYQKNKEGVHEKREKILASIIKDSKIPSADLNRIIKSMKRRGIFLVTTSGGAALRLKRILNAINKSEPISIVPGVMYSLRFKKVYQGENVFIILKDDLPPRLRNATKLKEVIYGELLNKWKELQKIVVDTGLKGYEKWKDGSGFACNICIADIDEGEITILYKRLAESDKYADAFSEEFKGLLMSYADSKKVGMIVKDKVKAREILKKQTISLLFSNLPEDARTTLLSNENVIMKGLKINEFIDISNIQKSHLEKVISPYLPKDQLADLSQKILKERDEYVMVVQEFNLF